MTNEHFEEIREISIHSPHAGRDTPTLTPGLPTKQFQSTLPMRGETAKLTNKSRANYT